MVGQEPGALCSIPVRGLGNLLGYGSGLLPYGLNTWRLKGTAWFQKKRVTAISQGGL